MGKVIWQPQPGSQSLALSCPAHHMLYHGTRGPGKTDAQIMKYRRYVGLGYGEYWRGIIFDKKYKNLDDIIAKSKKWFYKFNDGARFLSSKSDYKWVWPTGEELLIRAFEKPSDYENYHGQEFAFIGWNELSKYPTSECYDKMMSCNRTSFLPLEHSPDLENPLPELPLIVFSTTNPYGVGRVWIKKRYINKAKNGEVLRTVTNVFNPRTKKRLDVVKTQVSLFGSYKENRYLTPEYIAELENISDPNMREAWLNGNWDVTAGGAFDDLWKNDAHIIDRFPIPKNWKVTRSFDWGSSHPFSVGFWAVSNGEEVQYKGKSYCFAPGTLIRISEIYGASTIGGEKYGHNKGCKMSARDVAKAIKKRVEDLIENNWISSEPEQGPADGQIFNVNESSTDSIAKMMSKEGVEWYKADKSAGSRSNGFELVRLALENIVKKEGPGLLVMKNCEAFIETVPGLPRDEKKLDDVDTTAEDHVYDEVRYMVLDDKPVYAGEININIAM